MRRLLKVALITTAVWLPAALWSADSSQSSAPQAWMPSLKSCLHLNTGLYYPPAAMRQEQQGRLIYDYSVGASGKVDKVKLVLAEPDRTFVPAVLQILKSFKCDVPADWPKGHDPSQMFHLQVVFQIQGLAPVQYDHSDPETLMVSAAMLRREN